MSANGRRRWRKWAKSRRIKMNAHHRALYTGARMRKAQPVELAPLPAPAFRTWSLVGMTMGARKRAARFDARSREEFFGSLPGHKTRRWVLNLWHLGNNSRDPKKLNRMLAFAGEDPERVNVAEYARGRVYAEKRAKYRIGERLRPCLNPFCSKEDGCALRQCHGSGVLPARGQR